MGLQGSARTASTWAPIFIPSNARLRQADPPWGKNVKEIGVAERKASRKDTSGRHRHGLRRRHSRRGKAAFPQSCLAICHFRILPEYNTRVPVIYDHHDTGPDGRLLSLAVKRGGCGALGHLCSSGRHSDLLFSQDMQPSATSQRHRSITREQHGLVTSQTRAHGATLSNTV